MSIINLFIVCRHITDLLVQFFSITILCIKLLAKQYLVATMEPMNKFSFIRFTSPAACVACAISKYWLGYIYFIDS